MTMEQILTDLAHAQKALKASSNAFDDAMDHLKGVMAAIGAANHAQGVAIDAVIAATNAALALVKTTGGTQ